MLKLIEPTKSCRMTNCDRSMTGASKSLITKEVGTNPILSDSLISSSIIKVEEGDNTCTFGFSSLLVYGVNKTIKLDYQ